MMGRQNAAERLVCASARKTGAVDYGKYQPSPITGNNSWGSTSPATAERSITPARVGLLLTAKGDG